MFSLSYWFWPNNGTSSYDNPKVLLILGICVVLIAGSFAISYWRRRLENPMTRKLSRSWATASFWYGFVALILLVSRVEGIQFLSMRILWVLWIGLLILYVVLQTWIFSTRHYTVVKHERKSDVRDMYLPKKKK